MYVPWTVGQPFRMPSKTASSVPPPSQLREAGLTSHAAAGRFDVQCAQRVARAGIIDRQYGHSRAAGGFSDGTIGARTKRFFWKITANTEKATITKSSVAL